MAAVPSTETIRNGGRPPELVSAPAAVVRAQAPATAKAWICLRIWRFLVVPSGAACAVGPDRSLRRRASTHRHMRIIASLTEASSESRKKLLRRDRPAIKSLAIISLAHTPHCAVADAPLSPPDLLDCLASASITKRLCQRADATIRAPPRAVRLRPSNASNRGQNSRSVK